MKYPLLLFALFCSLASSAQYPDWLYLSKSYGVSAFAEEGNDLWIGNYSGLVKMDRATGAKTFYDKANSPIVDNWIADIVVDSGIKWIATHSMGIVRYDGINWITYDTSNAPLPGTAIQSIA